MRYLIICFLLLATACSAAPPAPPAATTAATPAPPAPTAAPPRGTETFPTTAPAGSLASATPAEAPAALLPAPLYVLERGQIARIEPDGATRNQVTRERLEIEGFPPISNFAVGPGSELAYVVGALEGDRLVRTGPQGEDNRTIYSDPGHELSHLVWAADGESLFLRLLNNKEVIDIPSGVYQVPAGGGEFQLIRADDPVDDPLNPSRSLRGYRPVALSPGGDHLLVEAFSLFYEGCDYAFLALDGSEPQLILPPEGLQTYCGEAHFAPDGSVLLMIGPPVGPNSGPTIWRAQPDGSLAPVDPAQPLGRAPAPLDETRVLFIQVTLPEDPAGEVIFQPALLPNPQPFSTPFNDQLERALWAPNGSGVVVAVAPLNEDRLLRWIPGTGEPVMLPSTREAIDELHWGDE
ncbi:MAG: hypothetical protein HC822_06015 [Oscillochloris sp.]|nr:hypothetical protein [Oscillochloris sp.]